jgi:hypothetical protein
VLFKKVGYHLIKAISSYRIYMWLHLFLIGAGQGHSSLAHTSGVITRGGSLTYAIAYQVGILVLGEYAGRPGDGKPLIAVEGQGWPSGNKLGGSSTRQCM